MEHVFQSERRRTLLEWPSLIDERLEILIRAAVAAGEPVSRAQMLAALVAQTDADPDDVADTVRSYRRLRCTDFAVGNDRDDLPRVRHTGRRRAS
ncbi:hypothetical protein ACXZ65_15980 [Streptomyces aculeolatus]